MRRGARPPDPTVLGPLLAYFGGDPSIDAHRRAHYAGMKAKSDAVADEASWDVYNEAYVRSVGVPDHEVGEAAALLDQTRHAPLWRWVIPETRTALDALGVSKRADGRRLERQRTDRGDAGAPHRPDRRWRARRDALHRRQSCRRRRRARPCNLRSRLAVLRRVRAIPDRVRRRLGHDGHRGVISGGSPSDPARPVRRPCRRRLRAGSRPLPNCSR